MKRLKVTLTSQKYLTRLVAFLRSLGQRRLTFILSFVVGILSGLAAVLLKNTIHFTISLLGQLLEQSSESYLFLALPGIGILITILILKYFIKDDINHGVTKILYSISRNNSKLKSHNTYSSILTSSITIGFGGSVGAEAPIVLTGSAIGSNIGQFFRLNYRTLTLLVGCGAAGAIASIFKAPLAGLIFTLEVLMLDLTMASIIPLLIAAVSGATVSYFLLGHDVLFAYQVMKPFAIHNIPWYAVVGVFCGLVSVYFIRVSMKIEKKYSRIKSTYKRWIIGSIILGLLIFIFPPLYGEGYNTLQSLIDGKTTDLFNNSLFYSFQHEGWLLIFGLLLILIVKVLAMSSTTGAGGIGGIFAPTLFMGGIAGFIVAKLLNRFGFIDVSESNFILIGMAGMMAGVMHAPLTAIFLIAEITGGYSLFIPLMITSTIAFITVMYFEPHSIYHKRLAQKGHLITHHKDKAVLTLLQLESVVEKDFLTVHPDDSLGVLVKTISQSKRNIFPVIDKSGFLLGVILLDEIRHVIFNTEKYDSVFVRELMFIPPDFISVDEPMDSVMKKFEETYAWNLPVVDNGIYIGFVSKSKIFSEYRKLLVQFSEE